GLIVLVHPAYGFGATLLAFFSVGLVSAALRNVAQSRRRTAEMARQAQELATLREISRIYAGTIGDELLFEKLFQAFRKVAPITAMAAASYEDDPEGQAAATLHGATTIERKAFLSWLASHRERETPYIQTPPNPTVSISSERELVLNPAHRFQILLPLRTPELIAGLLAVESDDALLIQPSTVQELTVLADHVALSLQDRGLKRQMQTVNERLQGRADTLHRILEVSNELKSHLTVELVLSNIVRAVAGSLGFRVVLLSLYDRTENVFDHRAQVGLDAQWETLARQRIPREEIARWFSERFRISKSYYVSHLDRMSNDDTAGFLRRRKVRGGGEWTSHDLLFIPLTAADQLVGVLQVDQPKSGRVPTLEDVQALEIFANQAVNAIQSARAYETTRQMSVKDSLTDSFNHRYFQETLYRELTRHERSGQSLTLLMIDIDDFKKINDRWGHPVGDLVLRGLVEELLKGVREMDTVARYGGEEFAVILPETVPDKGYVVADRLRARVASRLFVSPELSHPLTVSISIGLATFPEDANAKRSLIERADQALYQAKRSGKNCVVTAASLTDLRVG
ncbi:MAG TPA: diguanylate cyclase, partial [Thermoanaerobaculia bacterium]|nr:diguanylate cyclase [Thermoanaerobaculia bacterium]